jgi:hypothetical protein
VFSPTAEQQHCLGTSSGRPFALPSEEKLAQVILPPTQPRAVPLGNTRPPFVFALVGLKLFFLIVQGYRIR